MKKIVIVSIVAILILIAVVLIFDVGRRSTPTIASFVECQNAGYPIMESYPRQCRTPQGQTFTEIIATSTPQTINDDTIKVTEPVFGAEVRSPLVIKGQARGTWYFEASFPIQIIDGNGKVLVTVPVQALEEWMTTEFVPFEAIVAFPQPTTSTGTLILMNDNPSGDPERQQERRIPIVFKP